MWARSSWTNAREDHTLLGADTDIFGPMPVFDRGGPEACQRWRSKLWATTRSRPSMHRDQLLGVVQRAEEAGKIRTRVALQPGSFLRRSTVSLRFSVPVSAGGQYPIDNKGPPILRVAPVRSEGETWEL